MHDRLRGPWWQGLWALPRIWRYLDRPRLSSRTLYRRVRQVAVWRRPKLTGRGDPARDHAVAAIAARLIALPGGAVVLAEDETRLHLLPHVRASWPSTPAIPGPSKPRALRARQDLSGH